MKVKLSFYLLALCLFAGCAGTLKPTPDEIASADYGVYPDNYQEIATAYILKGLIDPYSAVFSGWQGPSKGWISDSSKVYFGYEVCVSVNAKNRMGGYSGSKLHYFLIKNDTFVHEGGDYNHGTIGEERMLRLCSHVGK